jgi:hypothetical protein
MFKVSRLEFPKIEGIEKIIIPNNGTIRFEYQNERVSIEKNEKNFDVCILSNGMLATAMPYFHKNYALTGKEEIIKDLNDYFANKKINKK